MKERKAAIFPRRNPRQNVDTTSIVASTPPQTQSQKLERLNQAIQEGETTEILENLAQSQIEGDLAVFITANLQDFLGRAV